MKKIIIALLVLFCWNAFGDDTITSAEYAQLPVEQDRAGLVEVGKRIVKSIEEGKPNYSCASSSGRDFCKTGGVHYEIGYTRKAHKATGAQLQAYVDSIKHNYQKQKKCLDPVFDGKDFISEDWKKYHKAIGCLKRIEYRLSKPNAINYFYIKPEKMFSRDNDLQAVEILTQKRNQLNPSLTTKKKVEDEPVTSKEFGHEDEFVIGCVGGKSCVGEEK